MVSRPFRIALFGLACLAISWLSLAPAQALPGVTLWDKVEHAGAYMALTLLGAWAFPHRLTRLAAGLFAFGVGVEILQSMMGLGRQGEPADALANTVGIAGGLLLTLAIRERIRVKPPAGGE
jgi:VanZ family protein